MEAVLAALLADPAAARGLALVAGVLLAAALPRAAASWRWPVGLLAATVAVLAVLALAAGPALDDFTYAVAGRDGWTAFQAGHWQGWSGRFLATAVLSGWPRLLPLDAAYPAMVLAVLATALSGAAVLAWRLLPADLPRHGRLAATAWILLALLAGWPSLSEGVYWLPGAVTYLLPLGLAAWALAGLLIPGAGAVARGSAVMLAGLACGGSEPVAIAAIAALATGAGLAWRRRDPGRWWWSAAVLAAIAACVVSFGAPGNRIRQHAVLAGHAAPEGIAAVGMAWMVGWRSLLPGLAATAALAALAAGAARPAGGRARSWLAAGLAAPVAAASLLVPPCLAGTGVAPRALVPPWVAGLGLLAMAAVGFGGWWGGRMRTRRRLAWLLAAATRSRQVPAGLLVAAGLVAVGVGLLAAGAVSWDACLAAAATGIAILVGLRRAAGCARERRRRLAAWSLAMVAGVAAAALVGQGSIADAIADLPRLPAHRAAVAARREAIAAAQGGDLELPLRDPRSILRCQRVSDITADPHDWSNRAMAAWHGLRSVRLTHGRQPTTGIRMDR